MRTTKVVPKHEEANHRFVMSSRLAKTDGQSSKTPQVSSDRKIGPLHNTSRGTINIRVSPARFLLNACYSCWRILVIVVACAIRLYYRDVVDFATKRKSQGWSVVAQSIGVDLNTIGNSIGKFVGKLASVVVGSFSSVVRDHQLGSGINRRVNPHVAKLVFVLFQPFAGLFLAASPRPDFITFNHGRVDVADEFRESGFTRFTDFQDETANRVTVDVGQSFDAADHATFHQHVDDGVDLVGGQTFGAVESVLRQAKYFAAQFAFEPLSTALVSATFNGIGVLAGSWSDHSLPFALKRRHKQTTIQMQWVDRMLVPSGSLGWRLLAQSPAFTQHLHYRVGCDTLGPNELQKTAEDVGVEPQRREPCPTTVYKTVAPTKTRDIFHSTATNRAC